MQIELKSSYIVAVGLLAVAAGVGGCGKSNEPPRMGPPEVAVVALRAERVAITTELPGRTAPQLIAEVRPQVGGIIQKRLFTEGSNVKAGEMLYQIDPDRYKAAYDSATANLAVARKAADRARAVLEATLTGVTRQKATVELARTNRWRYEELFKETAVSAGQRDQAVTEAQVAEAGLLAAEAQVKSDREAVAAAEAAIQQAEASLETARINLAYTRICAPIDGRIGRSSVTVGALVAAGQPLALAVIQQLDPIYVDATQSSANLLQLERNIAAGRIKGGGPGQAKAKLLLEDGTLYPLEGSLKFSEVTVDPGTGSVIMRMLFPNPKGTLLPGMYVRAVIEEGVVDRAILAPQQGISRDPRGNPIALVVDASEKVQVRPLRTDRAIGDKWLVTEGLNPGDRLIVEGLQKVRPGVPVKAVPFEPGRKEGPGAEKPGQPPAAKK